MGQPVTVVQKASSTPGVVRFEINRSITGMGHERYASLDDAVTDRPPDELARRLFAFDGVERVHINSNVITIGMRGSSDGMQKVIEDMFLHYRPGVRVPQPEDFA